jgi:hypothetical protein
LEPERPEGEVERGTSKAAVASALFAQPYLGITRITYVGLPEREAVHVALAASQRGLRPKLTRNPADGSTVAIEPRRAPAAPGVNEGGPSLWQRLVGAARRLGRALSPGRSQAGWKVSHDG